MKSTSTGAGETTTRLHVVLLEGCVSAMIICHAIALAIGSVYKAHAHMIVSKLLKLQYSQYLRRSLFKSEYVRVLSILLVLIIVTTTVRTTVTVLY